MEEREKGGDKGTHFLDTKGGMVGKFSKCAHLNTMKKTVEFTGNAEEEQAGALTVIS